MQSATKLRVQDSYRTAAAVLAGRLREEGIRSLVFASPTSGEGTTTTAVAVVRSLVTRERLRVLLVEFHGRRPRLASRLALDPNRSLQGVLEGSRSLGESVQELPDGLAVLPLDPRRPLEAGASAIAKLFEEAERSFDVVVWDAGPLGSDPDCSVLLSVVPRVVAVVQAGRLPYEVIERVRHNLETRGVKILGAILNKHRRFIPGWVYRLVSR